MEEVEAVVIGAGVVGLAIARKLALAGREVITLEANAHIGEETSSRNSEVIHAGIYYPQNSLKARFCVAGKEALYRFCHDHKVTHKRLGKLIVATQDEQLPVLADLKRRAAANGVNDLVHLDRDQVAEMEPEIHCVGALLSPSTGVVDSHGFMVALLGDAEAAGAMLAVRSPLTGAEADGQGFQLDVGGDEPMQLRCRVLVNSAGLAAQKVARAVAGLPPDTVPPLYYAKGNYYSLAGRCPFSHLIYPVPEPGGLGVHVTVDLGGQARFGPDVEWVDRIDYDVDPSRADKFYAAIRKYWPGLPDGAILPGYAGMRPKLAPVGSDAADFVVRGPAFHGVPGLVNLFGIESPGLTAALAIADEVAAQLS